MRSAVVVKGVGGGSAGEGLKDVALSVRERIWGMREGWREGVEMMNMGPERRGVRGWS